MDVDGAPGTQLRDAGGRPGRADEPDHFQHARGIPLKRLVSTSELASLAVLLASDQFPALTGEEIIVDGGSPTPSM